MSAAGFPFAIIDSHIHLYAGSHIPTLAWGPSLPEGHTLKRQNSVDQYREATKRLSPVGFVFVETDRESGLDSGDWNYAIEEIDFLRRIRAGTPIDGEGHVLRDQKLLLGAVAWAPLGSPVSQLKQYLDMSGASSDLNSKGGLIRGFRYLLQNKPPGTALDPNFIDGLLLLEQLGSHTFDLGVDFRQGGQWQVLETIKMLEAFTLRSNGRLKFVINHFCKPNMRKNSTDEDLDNWRSCIKRLAEFPTTYMKISGFFSELESQSMEEPESIQSLVELTRPFVEVVFQEFGSATNNGQVRIMFGSDWPVCNAGGPGDLSWQHWVDLVCAILDDQKLEDATKAMIWSGCARDVYALNYELPG